MASCKPHYRNLLEKGLGADNECTANYAASEVSAFPGSAFSGRSEVGERPDEQRVGLRGGRRKTNPTVDRFWARVKRTDTSSCWLFLGKSKTPSGHVHFKPHGQPTSGAHRYSWALHNGKIPAGKVVCHKCDVPACVNPAHLFLGSQADNIRDARLKQRPMGLQKLTEADVLVIRRRVASGERQADIAKDFSISPSRVSEIAARLSWAHLPEAAAAKRVAS